MRSIYNRYGEIETEERPLGAKQTKNAPWGGATTFQTTQKFAFGLPGTSWGTRPSVRLVLDQAPRPGLWGNRRPVGSLGSVLSPWVLESGRPEADFSRGLEGRSPPANVISKPPPQRGGLLITCPIVRLLLSGLVGLMAQ